MESQGDQPGADQGAGMQDPPPLAAAPAPSNEAQGSRAEPDGGTHGRNPPKSADVPASPPDDPDAQEPESPSSPRGRSNQARVGPRARAWHRAWDQPIHGEFLEPFRVFHASMDAVVDLHELITPHVAGIEAERFTSAVQQTFDGLDKDQMKLIGEFLNVMAEASQAVAEGDEKDLEAFAETYQPKLDKVQRELGDKAGAMLDLLSAVNSVTVGPTRGALLRGGLLTTAIGALEVLIAGIARAYYIARPEALGDEPKFSLKDLQEFDSLDDAREEAIASRVDSLVHGDLGDWKQWFEKNPKVLLENLALDFPTLLEVFQRRHVIVHNGGRVSRLYLKRMPGATKDLPELGAELPVDAEYLKRAFAEIEVVGDLLAVGTWSKCWPEEEGYAARELHDRSYDLMTDGDWQAVEKLASLGQLMDADASLKMINQLNEWLAIKRLNRLSGDIEQEVRAWDTSALAPRFKFVHAVLTDDLDAAFEMAPILLEREELTRRDLMEWPVLAELRDDPRFTALGGITDGHEPAEGEEENSVQSEPVQPKPVSDPGDGSAHT
jgi:hypothetical protein